MAKTRLTFELCTAFEKKIMEAEPITEENSIKSHVSAEGGTNRDSENNAITNNGIAQE